MKPWQDKSSRGQAIAEMFMMMRLKSTFIADHDAESGVEEETVFKTLATAVVCESPGVAGLWVGRENKRTRTINDRFANLVK